MADYLDATGLHIVSLEERNAAVKALVRALISPNSDLTTDQPTGQLIEIFDERTQSALELLREVYSAWDVDNATGWSLTALALLTGTQRRAATQGTVTLSVTLDAGITLPAGNVAAVAGDMTNRWVTTAAATNPAGVPAVIAVAAQCEDTGPVQALLGTITVIATPFAGWTAVTNAADAVEGLAEETDTALRLRRELELSLGGSTSVNAIRADLINLAGMLEVNVLENDLDVAVAGVAPHSFEAIIWDDGAVADADIAAAIFATKAAGIRSSGSTAVTVTDTSGNTHRIRFTRAIAARITVEVTIPAANRGADYVGDAAVAQALEDWANGYTDANGIFIAGFFGVGDAVYRSEISGLVVQLDGVENVSLVRLALWPAAVAGVDLTLGLSQIATIDNIDVTVL